MIFVIIIKSSERTKRAKQAEQGIIAARVLYNENIYT